jgi:hypothetical protein
MVIWRWPVCFGTGGRRGGLIWDALIGDVTMADTPDIDAEDIAEVVDETNLTEDGDDIANFDEMPRVLDVTSTIDDADDGDSEDDPDLFDEDERFDNEETAGDGSPRTGLEDRPDDAVIAAEDDQEQRPIDELVTTEDRRKPSRFESANLSDDQLAELGYRRRR